MVWREGGVGCGSICDDNALADGAEYQADPVTEGQLRCVFFVLLLFEGPLFGFPFVSLAGAPAF